MNYVVQQCTLYIQVFTVCTVYSRVHGMLYKGALYSRKHGVNSVLLFVFWPLSKVVFCSKTQGFVRL